MWFHYSICPNNGWRAGPRSRILPRPRCSATCPKPGGVPNERSPQDEATVILGNPRATQVVSGGRATLDDVFRRAVVQRPDAVALADPPNRKTFTDGAPLRLTYAEVDHFVSALAARLRRLELATDAVIALQLPNTVETVIMLLGVLRAGMIPALLPPLWRKAAAV